MNEFIDSAVTENQDGWDDWNETAGSDSAPDEPELNPVKSNIQEESVEQTTVDQRDDWAIDPSQVSTKIVKSDPIEPDAFQKVEETITEDKNTQIENEDVFEESKPNGEETHEERDEAVKEEDKHVATATESNLAEVEQDQGQELDEDQLPLNKTTREDAKDSQNTAPDSVVEEESVTELEPAPSLKDRSIPEPANALEDRFLPGKDLAENPDTNLVQETADLETPRLGPESPKVASSITEPEITKNLVESPIAKEEISSNRPNGASTDNANLQSTSLEPSHEGSIVEYLQKQLEEQTQLRIKHENNYQTLLGKLSSMRSVFSKMKQSQEELEVEKQNVKRLEAEKLEFINQTEQLNEECSKLNEEVQEMKKVQEQNELFVVEIDENKNAVTSLASDLKQRVQEIEKLKSELKRAKGETEEYLVALNEEKIVKNNLKSEVAQQKQLLHLKEEERDSIAKENYRLEDKIKELEEKVKILENEKKAEESGFQTRVNMLKDEVAQLKSRQEEDAIQLKQLEVKDTKISELSNEVKEKQLQIGTLRHEAVVLNEHLTKALKLIRKESSTESVDKLLVSNLFISFLNMPRGDTKKYEVLQLIANFLGWDETQKEHAGLIQNPNSIKKRGAKTESFVSLWTEFLEKETSIPK